MRLPLRFSRKKPSTIDDGSESLLHFEEGSFTLGTVHEDEEFKESDEIGDISEASIEAAKARTTTLAAVAKVEVAQLAKLLDKLETGNATQAEKYRINSSSKKISAMKKELETSKLRSTHMEMTLMNSTARKKMDDHRKIIKEKHVRSVIQTVCAAERADLAFVVDGTASMSPFIKAVKQSMRDIVKQIRRTNSHLNLRIGVVVYRDIGDKSRFEILDFVTSIDRFESFVLSIRAVGGADVPEDMAGGIQKVIGLSWKHPSRSVFIIADAPCHGTEYHSQIDSYPSGTPGIDIKKVLRTLMAKSGKDGTMSVHFGRITKLTDRMLYRLRKCGVTLPSVQIGDAKSITSVVTTGVRSSIFKTMTASSSSTKPLSFSSLEVDCLVSRVSLKRYSIITKDLGRDEWKELPVVPVKMYCNKPIKSMDDLQTPIEYGMVHLASISPGFADALVMFMRRAPEPFAEGEVRLAYHGQLARKQENLSKNAMVLKSFKHHGKGINDRGQYLKQMEISNIARFLASQYNSSKFRPSRCAKICILEVYVVETENDSDEQSGNRRYFAEEILPSNASPFTKFSNNTGYWNTEVLNESLLRFTKFTYEVTGGYLMIADLQGVRHGNEFVLTDPVIICKDIMRFGNTNLGETFMKKCMGATKALMDENWWA